MLHHFIQSHIHRVHVCSAVTGHLHFWQNGQDLLHAIVVTEGVKGRPEIAPTAPARTQTRNLSVMSPVL